MIIIPEITEEQKRQYQLQKDKLFIDSLTSDEKQTPMKPKGAGRIGVTKFGLCPTCGYAVVGDVICKECFQVIDWTSI